MIAWLLHLHGVWIGEAGVTKDPSTNPQVPTENTAIKSWLRAIPAGASVPQFRERLLALVDTNGPWLVKTSNLLRHHRLVIEHFPEARWVLPNRPIEEVVASDMRRRPIDYERSWNTRAVNKVMQSEICALGAKHHWVVSNRLASGDMKEAEDLMRFCGLDLDEEKARDWIQPELWNRAAV